MNDLTLALPVVVPLQGATNLRDLGGYHTEDGRQVAHGKLFRSAALHRLTDADMLVLGGLGIRSVCDFRGAAEQANAPSRLPDGATHYALCIQPTIGASLRELAENAAATGADASAVLQSAYATYPLEWAPQYRALFDLVLDGQMPLLFHCTAGKDRTGVAAALILSALGVSRATIHHDYLATNRIWQPDATLANHLTPAARAAMLTADLVYLDTAFAAIAREYPDLDGYFADRLGLDAGKRERLRAALLT